MSFLHGGCFLHGRWKDLESSNIYIVTNPDSDNPYIKLLTIVNNPAKDDRRDFEIRRVSNGSVQMVPMMHKDTLGKETTYDLYIDQSVPGRIIWYSPTTGRQRTWQFMLQEWNTTLVQLTGEVEGDVLQLAMWKLTGEEISKVFMHRNTSWRDARRLMVPGLRPLLSKKLAFVSPLGEVLAPTHNERPLSELLGCARGELEPDEAWRRFQ
ncbi:nipblb [Symbiodinium natans]|uniref:Nipblb protein n=1 Tax=Symbiodinium natans TaxID=878477 RepID=A0A812M335_9DINO|nr:nipblb [Symbiodinium natans]